MNPEEEKEFVLLNSLTRRNLSIVGKCKIGLKVWKLEEEKAKKRQGMRTDLTSGSADPNVELGVL